MDYVFTIPFEDGFIAIRGMILFQSPHEGWWWSPLRPIEPTKFIQCNCSKQPKVGWLDHVRSPSQAPLMVVDVFVSRFVFVFGDMNLIYDMSIAWLPTFSLSSHHIGPHLQPLGSCLTGRKFTSPSPPWRTEGVTGVKPLDMAAILRKSDWILSLGLFFGRDVTAPISACFGVFWVNKLVGSPQARLYLLTL